MRRTVRTISILAAAASVLAVAASPAAAKNGREGELKVTSLPNPNPVVVTCDDPRITSLPNQETLLVNPLSYDAGCFAVRILPNFRFSLERVVLSSGWTYTNKSNSDGTRIRLELKNSYTGQRTEALVTSGKTIIG